MTSFGAPRQDKFYKGHHTDTAWNKVILNILSLVTVLIWNLPEDEIYPKCVAYLDMFVTTACSRIGFLTHNLSMCVACFSVTAILIIPFSGSTMEKICRYGSKGT